MNALLRSITTFLFLASAAQAETGTGPHGGAIAEEGGNRFEIQIDPDKHDISVTTLKAKNGPPRSMSVTLLRDSGGGKTIELKTLSMGQGTLPKFHGELSPDAGSVIGIELRFATSPKGHRILKYVPDAPIRTGR